MLTTTQTIQVLSFATGLLAYAVLIVFSAVMLVQKVTGKALLLAALVTFAFIFLLTFYGYSTQTHMAELLSIYCWFALLLRALGFGIPGLGNPEVRGISILAVIGTIALIAGLLAILLMPLSHPVSNLGLSGVFAAKLILSVAGLVAVEQLVRNSREDLRWRLRYLNIGVSLIFAFTILQNSTGLMFSVNIGQLTIIQPLILALAVPFIVIASLRNRDAALRFNLSQKFIFRSGVLITAGLSFLIVSLAAYSVRVQSGAISLSILILVAAIASAAIAVVAGSTEFQTRLRRLISRLFYEDQRETRAHWAGVTEHMSEPHPDFTLGEQAIRAVIDVVDATSGILWRYENCLFVPEATVHFKEPGPLSSAVSQRIRQELEESSGMLDLDQHVTLGSGEDRKLLAQLRFLAPLTIHGRLIGVVGIGFPSVDLDANDVDQELVHLVAREVAGFLALQDAEKSIAETRHFDAINQLTTFLLHDIKSITAQLELLLQNAQRHKGNPEFIEDMLDTIGNVSTRMNALLRNLSVHPETEMREVRVEELIRKCLRKFHKAAPVPELCGSSEARVVVNPDKLSSALNHLLTNAVEATEADGSVTVSVNSNPPWVDVVVEDSGHGMDRKFIETELFSPFRSTKGVAGMGIGAYQVRSYAREFGGDVLVDSSAAEGSRFTVRLPISDSSS